MCQPETTHEICGTTQTTCSYSTLRQLEAVKREAQLTYDAAESVPSSMPTGHAPSAQTSMIYEGGCLLFTPAAWHQNSQPDESSGATPLDDAYTYASAYNTYTYTHSHRHRHIHTHRYTPRRRPSFAPRFAWFASHNHAFATPHNSSPVAPVRPCELHSMRASIHIRYTENTYTYACTYTHTCIGYTRTLTLPQTSHKRKGQCGGDI